jgi:uncharacterized DUF497 family protein
VRITVDLAKRNRTLVTRGLAFEDAALVFERATLEVEDNRQDYGEICIVCYSYRMGRMVVVGYTQRGQDRHVFSIRKANAREKARIAPLLKI